MAAQGFGVSFRERPHNLLTSLVNKPLITAQNKPGQETRDAMLERICQYTSEKLLQAGEGEFLRRRPVAYYVDLAERSEPILRARDMVLWLDRLEMEHEGRPRMPRRASIRGKALNASGSLMVMNQEIGRAPVRLEESRARFKEPGPLYPDPL